MKLYKLYTIDNKFIKESQTLPNNYTGIVVWSSGKQWLVDGKCHRLDGPAVEYADGRKYWWVNDVLISKEQCDLLYSVTKLKGLL